MSILLALMTIATSTPALIPLTEAETRAAILGHQFSPDRECHPNFCIVTAYWKSGVALVGGIEMHGAQRTYRIKGNVVEVGPEPSREKTTFYRDGQGHYYTSTSPGTVPFRVYREDDPVVRALKRAKKFK